ncbi:synaptogyrin-2 isoform X3 [Cinclus cinclus]|uniref:synaptogyrin-2 isoform X3 n=1 Tax=Cinclus cinclus TaxID=127875 RepID=UPI002E133F24
MEGGGGAYGAAKAGGAFDLIRFVQQPQVLARIVSAISNTTDRKYLVLADLGFSGTRVAGQGCGCATMAALSRDVAAGAWRRESLPSGVLPAGHALLLLLSAPGEAAPGRVPAPACTGEQGVAPGLPRSSRTSPGPSCRFPPTGLWTFLWFIGFCFLTNQWSWTQAEDVHILADSARAAITFSFFSIFSWGLLLTFAYKRYKMGVEDFAQSYADPSPEVSTPYSSYPNISHESYQQPPFTHTAEAPEGYQPPPVY